MRIVFMGTPDFAVPTLDALVAAAHDVICVYTQPPRPGGRRGRELVKTPVHQAAERLHIEVRHPESLKDLDALADFAALEPDLAVVAAYGLILPQPVLDVPKHGCLNVHASILPAWRGAAPIQRAILAGDSVIGVTIMQMEAGLDTGPMLATARTPIEDKTAGELTEELAEIGAQLMVGTLIDLPALQPVAQDDREATYASKIDKSESRIHFDRAAGFIERQIRAFAPKPGAWFELPGSGSGAGDERIKVFAADVIGRAGKPGYTLDDRLTIACQHGAIRPTRVQRAGKPAMNVADFLRGNPVPEGTLVR